jgi:hypothetical protein
MLAERWALQGQHASTVSWAAPCSFGSKFQYAQLSAQGCQKMRRELHAAADTTGHLRWNVVKAQASTSFSRHRRLLNLPPLNKVLLCPTLR